LRPLTRDKKRKKWEQKGDEKKQNGIFSGQSVGTHDSQHGLLEINFKCGKRGKTEEKNKSRNISRQLISSVFSFKSGSITFSHCFE
jgi:hypothetical protein